MNDAQPSNSDYISRGLTFPMRKAEDGTPLHPLTGVKMVEVEPGKWMDPIGVELDKMFTRAADSLMKAALRDLNYPAFRKYRDPWPSKGFDFRENSDRNRYPEPDYCECCGRSDDD
jgi:hypothetical protein